MKIEDIEAEVLDIAEYLGCNGEELWAELESLFHMFKNGTIQ